MLWYPKRRSQKKILTSPFKQTFSLSLVDNLILLSERIETFQKDKKMDGSQGDVNSTDTAILPSNPRRNTLKGHERNAPDQASSDDTSRELRRKPGLPDLERMTASRLRHQDSSATIKTIDLHTQSPDSSSRATGPGAIRQERRKKSALLEQDVSRMRSESRLGARSTEKSFESEQDRSFSRNGSKTPVNQANDGAETSDTEGSGPVFGDRRRKKSSTSSSSKKAAAAARASQFRNVGSEVTTRHSISPEDQFPIGKASRQSARRSSDANQNRYSSTIGKENTGRRTALPENFRSGSRADTKDWTTTSVPTGPRRSIGTIEKQHEWPRSTEANDRRNDSLPSANYRARRFASDPDADELPVTRSNRISVDTSSVSRYLGRNPTPRASSVVDKEQIDILHSPSEAARQRKVSASSTYSHRSSNGTSDLHRSASRASMRRAHGRDVFDDVPPMPELAGQTYSPRTVAAALEQRGKEERVHSLRERQKLIADGGRGTSNLDDLRSRIDELTGTGGPRSQSRASSRASRARSNMSSTPSTSVATTSATSVRPYTEPRKADVYYDRAQIELSPESKRVGASLRQNQTSRLGVQPYHENAPHTPDISHQSVIRRATSRLSVSQSAATSANSNNRPNNTASDSNGPLHARNLQSCIDNLESQLLRSSTSEQATSEVTREAVQLIERMREACATSSEINNGLRTLIQAILGFQIDAELDGDGQDSIEAFAQVERGLGSIVRWSDVQMRSLTDGLMALSSMWNAHTRQMLDVGDRSTDSIHARTRLAPRYTPKSPNKTNLMQEDRIHRRSSLDLRRLNSPNVRNTPWGSNRRGTLDTSGGQNAFSPQLSPNGEASSATSIASRNSNGSDHRSISDRSLRRFTASAIPGEKASPVGSNSPFSSTDSVSTKQTSSRIRQATRPVGEGIVRTPTYSNAHSQVEAIDAVHHSRTVSDVNPPSSAERANRDAFFPTSLSPLKTRPSLARVTTVNASTHQKLHDSISDDFDEGIESDLNNTSFSQDRLTQLEINESPIQQLDTQKTTTTNGRRASINSRRLSRQINPSFGDEDEFASTQSASADTVLATPSISSVNNNKKNLSNGSGLGLGLENVTSRIARSLGRNAGRRASQDVGTLTENLRTTKIDNNNNTRDDVD